MCKLAKLFIGLFILYIFWFFGAYGPQNVLLYGLAFLSTAAVAIDMVQTRAPIQYGFQSTVPLYFTFGIYAFLSGIFVSSDHDYFLSSMITYFAYTLMCYNAMYVSRRLGSSAWILNAILIAAILCTIQTIFFGVSVRSSNTRVITMGVYNNPNSLGVVMLMGIFAALSNKHFKSRFFLNLMLVIAFLYVIILCGSRKCLIAGAILMVSWIVIYVRCNTWKVMRIAQVIQFATICLGIVIIVSYIINEFVQTAAYERLSQFFDGDAGNTERMELYKRAGALWKERPILGIGFDQFRIVSTYRIISHSTYAEILACTGIVGCFIWLVGLVPKIKTLICKTFPIRKNDMAYLWLMLIVMFAIELFLGIGQVWIYDFSHMILIMYIFAPDMYWGIFKSDGMEV